MKTKNFINKLKGFDPNYDIIISDKEGNIVKIYQDSIIEDEENKQVIVYVGPDYFRAE